MGDKTFRGGVHPEEMKELSCEKPLIPYTPVGDLVFLTSQHIGKPATPVVKKGDRVLAGQIIAEASGFVSANIVSSVSGTVKAVELRPTAAGGMGQAIVITSDGENTLAEGVGVKTDYKKLTNQEILDKVKAAGIVGMGGAGFPTHVKLTVKEPEKINYIIANGAECEPYITCDDQLMRTCSEEIVEGLEIILRLFPKAVGIIGIERNKPQAIAAMEAACAGHDRISVLPLKTKYPQGGERSLISVVAGKHLKLGMLPADAGCVVDNVATIRAIYRAVSLNEPLMERTVTVSGDSVKNTGNFFVKIGTLSSELIDACGGWNEGMEPKKILFGGPMMGVALSTLEVPICKNNNAITALSYDTVGEETVTACLRCGRCNRVCPLGLSPQLMQVAAQRKNYDRYENRLYGLECIACGCCTYICPAKRPLMQLFKVTKAEIMAAKKK
ncbi:MAG: electron transport complex subunit RsxC [Firmicutes bacterium]|nr:electron transport complex subunit RsxC [Bacillota bacterium]MDY6161002.1 electron transport complex subunit RsxC [Candidatus Faecousia sp.]